MGSVGSGNALPCRWPCILKELKYYGMLIRRNLENPGSGFPRFAPGFCGFRKCIALLMAMHFKVKSYEMLVCHVGPARSSQGSGGSGGNALPCWWLCILKVKSYEMLVYHVGPARSSQGSRGSEISRSRMSRKKPSKSLILWVLHKEKENRPWFWGFRGSGWEFAGFGGFGNLKI